MPAIPADVEPRFTTLTVDESTEKFKKRLLALNCSPAYARRAADERRAVLFHISGPYEGNRILCARAIEAAAA